MTNKPIIHFGRFNPGYKDYDLFDLLHKDGLYVRLWLSGDESKIKNYFQSSEISINVGKYDMADVLNYAGCFCLLPYKEVTQSAALVESIQCGFIPIIPDIPGFYEFLPKNIFQRNYYKKTEDIYNFINSCDVKHELANLEVLIHGY